VIGLAVQTDLVSICICTYKRPLPLDNLLRRLDSQNVDNAFRYEVVVVDNDRERSSESIVRNFADRTGVETAYDCEPERNISLARNRAVSNASGNIVALIDDDEWPVDDWLLRLYRTMKENGADGVLGPVVPQFPPGAPAWLQESRFLHRPRRSTHARVSARDARTGNVMLQRSIFADHDPWFDPALGRTGGEDTEFFSRLFGRGAALVWCDEAVVFETVPSERWTTSFHLRRALRSGTLDGEAMRRGRFPSTNQLARNILIFSGCAAVAAPSLLLPKRVWMRVARKLAYSAGVVTAYLGRSLLRDRDEP
jgi:glycosyltransferase involved in cell wall biosynthesis